MNTTKNELNQISVPSKVINLEKAEDERIEIVLRPFKQRHFSKAIEIINKYFDRFNGVREGYLSQRKGIIDKYSEEATRDLALLELDAGFNEGMEIAKAILTGGGEVSEDIKTVIGVSIAKSIIVKTTSSGVEKTPCELDLDDLTWGECLVLLGSTVGLNMDFFSQNSKAMNLASVLTNEEQKPNQQPKDGEKLSPDSSKQVTATAK